MDYSFKPGQSVPGLAAKQVGKELERIQSKHGHLTPRAVVDESRPEDAEFHAVFEWNDALAAEAHRDHQARGIIHSVVIEAEPDGPRSQAFVAVRIISDDGSPKNVYEPAAAVAADPALRERHLGVLRSKLNSLKRELAAFEEFSMVCAAIEAVA